MSNITHEEWLQEAVTALDTKVFEGDLDLLNHAFQISWGKCKGKKITETIQPGDVEDLKLDQFFPTTIVVDYKQSDPITIMQHLTHECIKAFLGITKGKKFKKTAEKYYFEEPYKEVHCSAYLMDLINEAYADVVAKVGAWPGGAVVFPVKEKVKKINKYTLFCPECGMELTISKKMFDKYNGALPTCACGSKFARDLEEESQEKEDA